MSTCAGRRLPHRLKAVRRKCASSPDGCTQSTEPRPAHPERACSAVFPVFLRTGSGLREVRLHLRRHTGCRDGWRDPAGSGHADAGESAPDALIRESREEAGGAVRRENVRFAHLSHRAGATVISSF